MYDILTGKQRALVFPIMCNGHVKVDYSDNIPDSNISGNTSDDVAYGLWAHEGSFTFETTITPYEINGYGTYSALTPPTVPNSKKISPAVSDYSGAEVDYQSEVYLTRGSRHTHEMRVFNNANFKFSLKNNTKHNENEPASFQLKALIKLGTVDYTVTSDNIIQPSKETSFNYAAADDLKGLNARGRVQFKKIATFNSLSGTAMGTVVYAGTNPFFGSNLQEVFILKDSAYVSLGTISSGAGSYSSITLTTAYSEVISTTTDLYVAKNKSATYVDNSFHVACTFNSLDNRINLYYNGILIKSDIHSTSGTFSFAREDIYIGANGSGATGAGSASTNNQFMGELHEMAISSTDRNTFPATYNLLTNYDSTLLYFRFEEIDL